MTPAPEDPPQPTASAARMNAVLAVCFAVPGGLCCFTSIAKLAQFDEASPDLLTTAAVIATLLALAIFHTWAWQRLSAAPRPVGALIAGLVVATLEMALSAASIYPVIAFTPTGSIANFIPAAIPVGLFLTANQLRRHHLRALVSGKNAPRGFPISPPPSPPRDERP